MAIPHSTTVWTIRQGVRLAWALARASERLGSAEVRLQTWLETVADARDVDMRDVLEPLTLPMSGS
jgi:hypothetical protein